MTTRLENILAPQVNGATDVICRVGRCARLWKSEAGAGKSGQLLVQLEEEPGPSSPPPPTGTCGGCLATMLGGGAGGGSPRTSSTGRRSIGAPTSHVCRALRNARKQSQIVDGDGEDRAQTEDGLTRAASTQRLPSDDIPFDDGVFVVYCKGLIFDGWGVCAPL